MSGERNILKDKIIIDAANDDSNQVVAIIDGEGHLKSFDFENSDRQTTKSNIYLGRVLRVEHSLQAAFVEYGEDKSGFLPFSEIHPDYYQIPQADKSEIKMKLREEEKRNLAASEDLKNNKNQDDDVEDDEESDVKSYYMLYKKYNIQEVIKRGQNVLVQVFKDSRGNKGSSLTTYISLAGRYCVLMPNSPRGIGISKKIHSYEERRRILNVIKKFNVPYGTGIIVRTAGVNISERDLKRDYEYLVDLWNNVREGAIQSSVGSLVHKECSIVEQVIRDSYDSDRVSEIVVSGKFAYDSVTNFMKKLIPSDVDRVKFYADKVPILKKYKVTNELTKLLDPRVELPSGGYIIINPTEALTSVDVNSGKMHEKNIEETALKTNTEAAIEIAKQLKLRHIGGLIVVDFIDMNELKNKKAVELELRNAFADDKARVQFTRISPFGLIEISRQRMRSSIYEILTTCCTYCNGLGVIKSPSVIASDVMDAVNQQFQKLGRGKNNSIELIANKEVIDYFAEFYVNDVKELEAKHGVKVCCSAHLFKHPDEFIVKIISSHQGLETVVDVYNSIQEAKKHLKHSRHGFVKKFINRFIKKKNV
jgi:ribonuclease E